MADQLPATRPNRVHQTNRPSNKPRETIMMFYTAPKMLNIPLRGDWEKRKVDCAKKPPGSLFFTRENGAVTAFAAILLPRSAMLCRE